MVLFWAGKQNLNFFQHHAGSSQYSRWAFKSETPLLRCDFFKTENNVFITDPGHFFFKYLVGQVKIVLSHSQILLQDTIINSLTCSNVSNPPPSFLYHCILPSPYKRKWKLSVKKFLQIWCPQIHYVLSHKRKKNINFGSE